MVRNFQQPSSDATKNKRKQQTAIEKSIPLAEKMRPDSMDDYVGQEHVLAKNAILRKVLDQNDVPSMILWGPPGCGKVKKNKLKLITFMKRFLSFFFTDNIGAHNRSPL